MKSTCSSEGGKFNFNLNDESELLIKPEIINDRPYIPMTKIKLSKELIEFEHDIDAILGIIDSESIYGIKSEIFLKYKRSNMRRILNKNVICSTNYGFNKINNFYNVKLVIFKFH